MGKVIVVAGGQFGSEAKGHIAAYLGRQEKQLLAIRVGGPNAGHTVYDLEGRKWSFRHLPVAAVQSGAYLGIAAGSEINPQVLQDEIAALQAAGYDPPELSVDPEATVILPQHIKSETDMAQRIGSTAKGIGAARADRIWRMAPRWRDLVAVGARENGHQTADEELIPLDVKARHWLDRGGTVLIEGTQGYGLGLHAGYYPYCTSGDCRAIDFMAQVGLSPWDPCIEQLEIWVVFRTFPIRVAGNSGPMYRELSWEDMQHLTKGYVKADKPERTTVTNNPRRIGMWDAELANAAIDANGRTGVHVALTFADYIDPSVAGQTQIPDASPFWEWLEKAENDIGQPVELIATGPTTVIDGR